MMPKQQDIEVPLLAALEGLGGTADPKQLYGAVTKAFSQMTQADLLEKLPSGGNKWTNRIQWVRQRLVAKGEMNSPAHGVWGITASGLARLKQLKSAHPHFSQGVVSTPATPAPATSLSLSINLEEVADDYLTQFIAKVLQKLHDLKPDKFEEFAGVLLKGYGFQKINVTGKSGDGGIDGHGELRVGLAVVRAAFQCKRWQGSVGSKEVQAFRGAIQGQFEQGYFFTTSTFSKAAQAESIKIGAAPIILFEGQQIVQIMIEKGIGVKRRPVELYEDQVEDLFES